MPSGSGLLRLSIRRSSPMSFLGEDEVKSGTVVLRDMARGEQKTVSRDEVAGILEKAEH